MPDLIQETLLFVVAVACLALDWKVAAVQAVVLTRCAENDNFVAVSVVVDAPWPQLVLWRPIVAVAAETAAAFVFAAATAAAFVDVADPPKEILHKRAVVASTNPPTFQNLFVGEQSEVVVGQRSHVQPQEVLFVTGLHLTNAVDLDSLS